MKRLAPAALAALLLIPGTAEAKGTNVRLDSAPNGRDAGEAWRPQIKITMPGNGLLGRLRPAVIIRHGAVRKRFAAHSTGRRGVYTATVVFPARGRWRYGVYDGFDSYERGAGKVHAFPPVTIGPNERPRATPPKPISGEIDVDPPLDTSVPFAPAPAPRTATRDDDDDTRKLAFVPAFLVPLGAAVIAVRRRRARTPRA